MMRYNPNIEHVNDIVYTKSQYVYSFWRYGAKIKFWCKLRVVTLLRLLLYNSNIDIDIDNVYIKFCLNLSIRS